jgi:hypothetical protein
VVLVGRWVGGCTLIQNKNPQAVNLRVHEIEIRLRAVVANGFDRAALLGFFAPRFLFRRCRLLVDERVTAILVAFEIVGGGFATEVAVNALIVHVILAGDVFGIFVCHVCHKNHFLN